VDKNAVHPTHFVCQLFCHAAAASRRNDS